MTVPSKWNIAQHWTNSPDRARFAPRLYDLGEPCCFACGWYSEHWDKTTARASWERAKLERAHIVPSSLGGSDELDNLLLLCAPCHEESPDWPDPREMGRWIAARPDRSSQELEMVDVFLRAVEEVPEFVELVKAVAPEVGSDEWLHNLLRASAKRAGIHGGKGLSPGTQVAILRDAVERARGAVPNPTS